MAFGLLFGAVVGAVVAIAVGGWRSVAAGDVVVWAALCAVANLLPVPASRNVYLSMSAPVNVAIATVFPVGVAAAVVAVGSLSTWELQRATRPTHALFNRCQLALSAAAAGWILDDPVTPGRAVGAVVAYQLVNWLLVGAAERTFRGTPVRDVVRRLVPAHPVAAVVYLALGLMGVALGMAAVRVGLWSVALLMLPLLGARQAVRAERERRLLADRLVDERERERLRIAGDIHDVVLQQLAAVRLQADNVASAIAAGRSEQATTLLAVTGETVERTIADLRRSVASLRRTTLDDAGLAATLERYGRAFASQSGIEVSVEAGGDVGGDSVATTTALLIYETCQEALTNVAQHADARRVTVSVAQTGRMVELSVADDGRGFVGSPSFGMGLSLIEDKVALAGGTLSVSSGPGGRGTTLVVRVPSGSASS